MGNNKMLVEERSRDIGNFMVGRLLPFRRKRQVGPFTFIDHMGPSTIGPGRYMDVDQHPHIGLSTLTYLLEGEMEHRDSTGAVQLITPGAVGFMTAGYGVTHTERTPQHLRDGNTHSVHGYQVWVALPKEQEDIAPSFAYLAPNELPQWEENGIRLTLVAGEGYGRRSPLPVYSPLFMVDAYSETTATLDIKGQLSGEIALVVVKGAVQTEDEEIAAGQMLIAKTEDECCVDLQAGTRLLLFGGQAFPEERFLHWNFVSSSKEKLEQAKRDWAAREFPVVPGDNTYIP
ncbi:MAG: pirin family protein, partial [Bacteroidota bacterium]